MTALRGLFVVGTDTGVGKTRVAAAIARALVASGARVGVLKPVATGIARTPHPATPMSDADVLIESMGGDVEPGRVAPLVFEEPLAPPVAARRAGAPLAHGEVRAAVGQALDWWAGRGAEVMVVEGVGGLLCPLAEGTTVADLAVDLDYPLVIVARRGLGTLNHTLLTVEAARRRALRVAGIVLNGAEPAADPRAEATNPAELARRLDGIAIVADIPYTGDLSAIGPALEGIDWLGRSAAPRLVRAPAADPHPGDSLVRGG